MTTYVLRDGKLVEKRRGDFTEAPRVSRFETYESPVTGAPISSHRQRDLDLYRANAYDERDVGPNHEITRAREARKADNGRPGPTQLDFWRD